MPTSRLPLWIARLALLGGLAATHALAQAPSPNPASTATPRCTQPLRVAFVDVDLGPYLPGQGDAFADPPGHFVNWVRREAARWGCAVTLSRLPPARLQTALAQGEADIGIGLAPTPEREKTWVFPRDAQQRIDARLSLFEAEVLLLARQDAVSQLGWNGRDFARPVTIGGAKGSAPLTLVQNRGWKAVPVMSTPQGLRMLRAGRFDLLVAPSVLVEPQALAAAPALVPLHPPLAVKTYYAPVSPALWKDNPALVRALWRGLCRTGREHAGHSTARCDAGAG